MAVLTGLEPATIPQTTGYPTIGRQDLIIFADVTGVEPAPNCVTGRHLNHLTSHPYLSNRQDSNLRADASNAPEINHSSTTRYLFV